MSFRLGDTRRELLRYVIVGLVSNASLFIIYLVLTGTVFGPKTAMSVVYVLGVLGTFILNRNWTFGGRVGAGASLRRYVFAYASGYVINYVALLLLVDVAGLPHVYVQAVMAIVIALFLFGAQKFWVFGRAEESGARVVELHSLEQESS